MSEIHARWNAEQLRRSLNQLFHVAGYVDEELEQFFEEAVSSLGLSAQNKPAPKGGTMHLMHSKLRDALRE